MILDNIDFCNWATANQLRLKMDQVKKLLSELNEGSQANTEASLLSIIESDPNILTTADDDDGRLILNQIMTTQNVALLALVLNELMAREQIDKALIHADSCGWTVMHQCASLGNLEALNLLLDALKLLPLETQKRLLVAPSSNGQTPLHYAASKGHYQVVLNLVSLAKVLEGNGSWSIKSDKQGQNAMHRAASCGYTAIVNLLFNLPPSLLESADAQGMRPLHLACERGHEETVKWLLEHGARTDAVDSDGRTPVQCASQDSIKNILNCAK